MAGGGVQAGRLSIEIVAEIARLQADLDKAKRLMSAASGDIAKNARAANDNLRSIGVGAGAGLQQFSRDVAALKGQLDPSFAALQKYKQEVALLQKALGEGAITHKQFVEQMRGAVATYKSAGTEIVRTTGAGRNFTLQMSQVAQQVSAGTSVLQALAIQLPDIAAGMSAAGAGAKGFAGFLAGHWGLAITAGLALLVPFVAKLWEAGDAASETKKRLDNMASSAARAAKAEEGNTLIQKRSELIALQERLAGRTKQSQAFFAGTQRAKDIAKEVAALDKQIDATAKLVGQWNQRAEVAERQDKLNNRITASTDKVAAATQAYEGALKTLNDERVAGTISDEEYVRQGIALQKQLDAVKNSDREAAKATRENAKAARDAAKAQKEYEESLLGRVESGTLLGQMATELDKSIKVKVEWGPSVIDEMNAAHEAKQRLEEAEDYMDDRARDRFMRVANEFADIVGGRLGDSIARMASVLDRFVPGLTKQLGGMLKGVGGWLGGVLKGAGIGGAAAGVVGGSAMGGMVGGALGQGVGTMLAPMLGQLGAFAGPLGAIAGGILGGVVGGLLKKTKKASATIEIMAGDAVQSSLTGNSSKLKATAGAMADSLIGGLMSIADQLGGMLGDGIRVSIGQRNKKFRVDLQGLGRTKNMPSFDTQEEAVAYAIQEVIRQGAIVGLRAGTETLLKGQGDLEAQLQKALTFENVFREIEQRANPAKASMSELTKQFSNLIDIFEEAGASAADYAQLQQLMADKQREIIEQAFDPIRTMLDDLKAKATEAGDRVRTAFDAVIQREADAVAAYQAAIEAKQQAARQKAIESLQDSLSTLRSEAQAFGDAAARLRDFSATVFGTPSLAALRANFARTASKAQGGNLDALGALPGAGQALRDAVVSNASDRLSMVRELNKIRIETDKSASMAEGRATTAERQAAAIEKQLETMQKVEETTVSIEQLAKEMQTAQQAADLAREQMAKYTELVETELSFAEAVAEYEEAKAARDDLMRQITTAGFADLITAQQKTGDQLIAALQEVAITAQLARSQAADAIAAAQAAQAAAAAAKFANDNLPWANWMNGIPGFAAGGQHTGGLRIVGEDGPELEATGPARYYSASDTAAMLGRGPSADEIGQAVANYLHSDLYQIAKPLKKIDDRERRWDGDGLPPERSAA